MRIDLDLVRRVEHSAAELGVHLVAGYVATDPTSVATSQHCDGGALVSFGPGRYVNRAIGLGLHGTPALEIVAELDRFFVALGLPPSLELTPWADDVFFDALAAAGYRLERFRNVYVHALRSIPSVATEAEVVAVDATAMTRRHEILAGGAPIGSAERTRSDEYFVAAATMEGAHDLVAMVDGRPAACGSLHVVGDTGWLGGAGTDPVARGAGLQSALVAQRLHLASTLGCTLAAATAMPAGQSARNLARLGFTLLYTQAVMTKDARAGVSFTRGSRGGASA